MTARPDAPTSPMTAAGQALAAVPCSPSSIVEFVRRYNRWRRGDESLTMESPEAIGEALDAVCDRIETLERWVEEGKVNGARCAEERDRLQDAGEGCSEATCSRVLNALRRLYEAADVYVACQDRATDDRCGLVQPITVADGNELIAAQCEALETLQSAEKRGWVYSANSQADRPR